MSSNGTSTIKIRHCPKCRGPLQEVTLFGLELDRCDECAGLWFDVNELDQMKANMDETIRWIDIDLWRFAERAKFNASQYECPKCETVMSELAFDNSNVTLEFCINCGGAWLDDGELNSIVKIIQEKMVGESLGESSKASLQQFMQLFGGPKGLLEESRDIVAAWRMVSTKFAVTHPILVGNIRVFRSSIPF